MCRAYRAAANERLSGVCKPARGDRALHPGVAAAETAFELSWRQRVDAHLSVQSDLQYIEHPALAPASDHALVIGAWPDGRV